MDRPAQDLAAGVWAAMEEKEAADCGLTSSLERVEMPRVARSSAEGLSESFGAQKWRCVARRPI